MRRTLAAITTAVVIAGAALAGAITPTTAGHPAPALATCLEEDGSTPGQPFPCAWNGRTMGNGQGSSYVLTEPATCAYARSQGPVIGC